MARAWVEAAVEAALVAVVAEASLAAVAAVPVAAVAAAEVVVAVDSPLYSEEFFRLSLIIET